jgi:hypothetical protein
MQLPHLYLHEQETPVGQHYHPFLVFKIINIPLLLNDHNSPVCYQAGLQKRFPCQSLPALSPTRVSFQAHPILVISLHASLPDAFVPVDEAKEVHWPRDRGLTRGQEGKYAGMFSKTFIPTGYTSFNTETNDGLWSSS